MQQAVLNMDIRHQIGSNIEIEHIQIGKLAQPFSTTAIFFMFCETLLFVMIFGHFLDGEAALRTSLPKKVISQILMAVLQS